MKRHTRRRGAILNGTLQKIPQRMNVNSSQLKFVLTWYNNFPIPNTQWLLLLVAGNIVYQLIEVLPLCKISSWLIKNTWKHWNGHGRKSRWECFKVSQTFTVKYFPDLHYTMNSECCLTQWSTLVTYITQKYHLKPTWKFIFNGILPPYFYVENVSKTGYWLGVYHGRFHLHWLTLSKREVPRGVRNSKVRRQDKFRRDWSRH